MEIKHIPEEGVFETEVDGYKAYVKYQITEEGLDVRHTRVPEQINGRGIAAALVKAAYDFAKENGFTPVASCSYAQVWLQRHPEYEGSTGRDFGGAGSCAL